MARTARLKIDAEGTAYYHLVSRTNDRRFLFSEGKVKTALVDALARAARFSGIEIEAFCAMDNHFHVVCKVVRTASRAPDEELVRRVASLKGKQAAEEMAEHWKDLEATGLGAAAEEAKRRLWSRMNDISGFVKTFKETFNVWYRRERDYCGSLWSGRFKSTLIEDGKYLEACRRYVCLNPVRAGIVSRAEDYAWSGRKAAERPFAAPAGWPPGRVAQVADGKVLGGLAFVERWIAGFGERFRARSVAPHPVWGDAYSTHGWKLARKVA